MNCCNRSLVPVVQLASLSLSSLLGFQFVKNKAGNEDALALGHCVGNFQIRFSDGHFSEQITR